jgi:hypothetical protein
MAGAIQAKIARGLVTGPTTEEMAEIAALREEVLWSASDALLRSDLDPMVMSAVMVSILFGRVVDDLSARPVAADDWNAVWMQAVRAILFPV